VLLRTCGVAAAAIGSGEPEGEVEHDAGTDEGRAKQQRDLPLGDVATERSTLVRRGRRVVSGVVPCPVGGQGSLCVAVPMTWGSVAGAVRHGGTYRLGSVMTRCEPATPIG